MKDSLLTDSLLMDSLTNMQSVYTSYNNAISVATNYFWGMPEGIARIVVPTVITLLVFVFGQIIIWYRSQTAIKKEVKTYRNMILTWIDLTQESVEKLIKSCRELSHNIKESQDIQPESFDRNKMLAEKMNSIGIERYISTFMTNCSIKLKEENKKEKMTYNLISNFSFLESIETIIIDTYKDYKTRIEALQEEWNNDFNKLIELISDFVKEVANNENHPHFVFKKKIVKACNNWENTAPNGKSTMSYSMSHLIALLTKIVNEELKTNIKNEFAFRLSAILQQFDIIDLKWKSNIKGNSKLFKDIADSIDRSYKALLDAKKYFQEKTKIKNRFLLQ